MKAYNDPKWSEGDREMFRAEGLEVTTAEVEAEGILATQCGYCGHVDDKPEDAVQEEDRCPECERDFFISTGFLIRRRGVDYFLGHA